MSGHPEETEQDFQETLAFAKAANLSYASFNPLKPYPGTGMYEEVKSKVNFSVYPYQMLGRIRKLMKITIDESKCSSNT